MENEGEYQPKESHPSSYTASNTFQGLLRGKSEKTEKLYKENKLIYPYKDFSQLRPNRGPKPQIVNMVGTEDKYTYGKIIRPVKDNVMFNDDYVETNHDFRRQKRQIDPTKINTQPNKPSKYCDEPKPDLNKNKNLSRRVQDCYGSNPIEVISKEKRNEIDQSYKNKVKHRTAAVSDYLGSKNISKTFKSLDSRSSRIGKDIDKVTNIPESRLNNAIRENKTKEQTFNRRSFKKAIGEKGKVFYE